MKIKKYFQNVFYGFLIGVAMLIPGVSGGTIAVVLGIYDDLLSSVADIFKQFKESLAFLSAVAIGGVLGFISMAGVVRVLLDTAKFPIIFFFMGVIVSSVFVTTFNNKSTISSIKLPMLIFGAMIVILVRFIPNDLIAYGEVPLLLRFAIMIIAGLMLGGALILPGISFSMTLMTLGLYETFLKAVNEFNIHILLPIIFATLFGTIVLSKLLSNCLNKYPDGCQSMIIGFVIASLGEMFPGIPRGNQLYCSLVFMVLGISISFVLAVFLKRRRE